MTLDDSRKVYGTIDIDDGSRLDVPDTFHVVGPSTVTFGEVIVISAQKLAIEDGAVIRDDGTPYLDIAAQGLPTVPNREGIEISGNSPYEVLTTNFYHVGHPSPYGSAMDLR